MRARSLGLVVLAVLALVALGSAPVLGQVEVTEIDVSSPASDIEEANHSASIRVFADLAGESAPAKMTTLASAVRPISRVDLPPVVSQRADAELASRIVLAAAASTERGSAHYRHEGPFVALLRENVVIGYAVSIEDDIDHPGFRGAGVHIYFDVVGEIVTAVEWIE